MLKFDVWSRTVVRALVGGAIAAALTACGGGGGSAGDSVFTPTPGASSPSTPASAVAADVVVVLSKSTMTNSGSDSITATVTTIDSNRAAIGSVPVTVSVNANAVVSTNATATNSAGVLTATVTQGSDSSVRPVTLTVKSGEVTRAVTFNVVQQSTTNNPQANDLTLILSGSSVTNSGSTTITATATAVDGNRNALPGIPVQLSVSDPSAFLVSPASETNASGQVTGTVNIGQDRSNRTITVVATSGTLTRTAAFQVTGARFSQASPVPAVASVGAAGTVQYTLTDVNSNPMTDVPITVSGNGVATKSGKTDLNGAYKFEYTTPNAPGSTLTIKAVAGGVDTTVSVPIPGGGSTTVPVATLPVAMALNLSADVVPVNTANTANQVTVNAFFRDGANAPIPNVRVLFRVTGDNGTGAIGSGANTVLSDASGAASTTYTPGSVSSPTNGVTVQACWKVSDFAAGETAANCVASGGQLLTTTLTIVSNPVSISIGTDNKITSGPSGLTYAKKYVVLVVDSAGNPKPDVQITPSLDLGAFGKGDWYYDTGTKLWRRIDSNPSPIPPGFPPGLLMAVCPNEDLNRNAVIDTAEDINGNQQLDPRKSDVAITLVGATKTDANGVAVLQLEYPKSLGSWVKFKITVTAAGVLSPPAYYPLGIPVLLPSRSWSNLGKSRTQVEDYLYTYAWLPVATEDISVENQAPPFRDSPYGLNSNCETTR